MVYQFAEPVDSEPDEGQNEVVYREENKSCSESVWNEVFLKKSDPCSKQGSEKQP
jgi:hypothetical protein